jgi:hypothetical protein
MGGYASGKYSQAVCDQCGFQFPLNSLKKEWTGFKVCQECYEPKHPQLEPLRYAGDAIAVYEPRPDRIEPVTIFVGSPGSSLFGAVGMRPEPIAQAIIPVVTLGNVTVTVT